MSGRLWAARVCFFLGGGLALCLVLPLFVFVGSVSIVSCASCPPSPSTPPRARSWANYSSTRRSWIRSLRVFEYLKRAWMSHRQENASPPISFITKPPPSLSFVLCPAELGLFRPRVHLKPGLIYMYLDLGAH